MTPPDDTAMWRNRFILINLTRIGGTIVVLIGLVIWQTDWVNPGGLWQIGLPMALIGLIVSFAGPQWLAARWKTPPE